MDPLVDAVPPGTTFSIVAHMSRADADGIAKCYGLSPAQSFTVLGAGAMDDGVFTMYGLSKMAGSSGIDCEITATTKCFRQLPKSLDGFSVLDLCSGMGGFSIGSQQLGIPTYAFVEKNELACLALRANFLGDVYESDVCDESILIQLHETRPEGFLQATGGFPCQGYSLQGDGKGLADSRSRALPGVLRCAWLLRLDSLLLECVDNVIHYADTQALLDKFTEAANHRGQRLTFDLRDQWPMRRNRFWFVTLPVDLPELHLEIWPKTHHFSVLGDIMKLNAVWSDEDENDLQWDHNELYVYGNPSLGAEKRILESTDGTPTVLHSWGHVTRPCPCNCRPAFSMARLQTGGVRGFGLRSAKTSMPRHLHPEEAATLCTVPASFRFPQPARFALPLLGQIAAPLQVLWIQSQVLRHLQVQRQGTSSLDPHNIMLRYQYQLISDAAIRWTTRDMHIPRDIQLRIDGQPTQIKLAAPATIQDLKMAERALTGSEIAEVLVDGLRLPDWAKLLPDATYHITTAHGSMDFSMAGLSNRTIWQCQQLLFDEAFIDPTTVPCFTMFPFQATQFLDTWMPKQIVEDWQTQYQHSSGHIIQVIASHNHWIVLSATSSEQPLNGLRWTLYDGLADGPFKDLILAEAVEVASKLSAVLLQSFLGLSIGDGLSQHFKSTCGTIAIGNIARILGLGLLDPMDELFMHQALLECQPMDGAYRALGIEDSFATLRSLLNDKGVPETAVADRAKLIMNKLGPSQVASILKSKNPWAGLKGAASKPGNMFRLVLADELNAHISKRAKHQHGASVKNHKNKKANGKPGPLQLDPKCFELDQNHFQGSDGNPIKQIDFQEVGADQQGVALCTTAMAHRFFELNKTISVDALALLIIDHPPEEIIAQAGLKKFAFPAYCPATDEHTVIFGYILQLGDEQVRRNHQGKTSAPEVIATSVIKFQVHQDQLEMSWAQFAKGPVRAMVYLMDSLKLCAGKSCGADCNKFHAGIDETIDGVIFEIWSRTFFNAQGQRCDANKATSFTVFFRTPVSAVNGILQDLPDGIYAEPRGENPREHDPTYKVVWLPGASYEEAKHCNRTCSYAICLARLKTKYGLRVKASDESQAWAILRPGVQFEAIDITHIYELFPIPHGTQKTAITKLLADWQWKARALQPGRGNLQHMAWKVGSTGPPPHRALHAFNLDVVVTPVKELKTAQPTPKFIASTKTQKHLREAPANPVSTIKGADLLQEFDPWARKPAASSSSAAGPQKDRLSEIRTQLCDEVKTAVRKELEEHASAMDTADSAPAPSTEHEDRVRALEVGLTEIKQQQGQFLNWFTEAGDHFGCYGGLSPGSSLLCSPQCVPTFWLGNRWWEDLHLGFDHPCQEAVADVGLSLPFRCFGTGRTYDIRGFNPEQRAQTERKSTGTQMG